MSTELRDLFDTWMARLGDVDVALQALRGIDASVPEHRRASLVRAYDEKTAAARAAHDNYNHAAVAHARSKP